MEGTPCQRALRTSLADALTDAERFCFVAARRRPLIRYTAAPASSVRFAAAKVKAR